MTTQTPRTDRAMLVRLFRICLVLALIGAGCVLYGWQVEPRRLVVREVAVPSAKPAPPLRIAFISDIHAGGKGVDARRVRKLVRTVMRGEPDVILIAGDLINGHDPRIRRGEVELERINRSLAPLADLDAPLGVYGVAGNHDNWFGGVDDLYGGLGIRRIDNGAQVLEGRACVFGVADEWTAVPNADGLLACVSELPGELPVVGVMHNPDSAYRLPLGADLLLAGHTHGGQVNLPVFGRVVTSTNSGRALAYGLADVRATPIFVTAGVGMSILPVRFRAPPEVVFITLG